MILTPQEALALCYEVGFRWNAGIVVMPCIGWAESRLRSDAEHTNTNGTIDRGWLQINSIHVDAGKLTVADCFDARKSAEFAFKLSNGGTKFTPWSTFNSGAYKGPEGLVYALFMAEWRDKAGRMSLANAEATLVGVQAANERLAKALADTKTELGATTASLQQTTLALAQANDDNRTNLATIERMKGEYDEIARIAIDRATKIDNARAALA
jgi:hypothetical protein